MTFSSRLSLVFLLCLLLVGACFGAAVPTLPGSQLQAEVDRAIAAGLSYLAVGTATYMFNRSSFYIRSARGFTLSVKDSPETPGPIDLVFYPGFGVVIQDSIDSSVLGPLIVRYDPPCFTQGVVQAVDDAAKTMDVKVAEGFPTPDVDYFTSGEIKLQYFSSTDYERQRLREQGGGTIVTVLPGAVSPGVFRLHMNSNYGLPSTPVPGMLVTVSPRIGASRFEVPDFYKGQSWTVYNSTRITTQDVSLYGSGNFAVLEWGGEGAHVYRRLILSRYLDNLLSSNCDGFHSFSVGQGGTIIDSVISWMGDDAINYHNRVGVVLTVDSAASAFTFVDVGDIPNIDPNATYPATAFADLRASDTLRLFAGGQTGPQLGVAVVRTAVRVTDPQVLAQARTLAAHLPAIVNLATVGAWLVTYTTADGPVLPLQQGDVVQFDRRSSFGGLIKNTLFTDAYDSCARFQASNSAITDCTFLRLRSGMTVVYDPPWLEGSRGIENVTISNNVFTEVSYPSFTDIKQIIDADKDVQNLVVEGNTINP